MLCLGIETSCDETALALVRDGKCVESVLATQMDGLFKTHRQLYCPSFVVLPKASGLLKILQNLVHLAEADLRTNSLLSRILFPLRLRNPVSLLVQSREPRHQELQKVRVFPCTSSEIIAVAEFGLYH